MDILNLKRFFNERTAISIYLILLIIINIFDFLNMLEGDIDFIEKLTSWLAIGFLFYHLSITKIFLGIRYRAYDLFLILAFSLMVIPKSLVQYVITSEIDLFFLFYYPLEWVSVFDPNDFVTASFLLGLSLTILLSIILTLKGSGEGGLMRSLLGEGKFSANIIWVFVLASILVFFSMTVFNFFMEWFALAVDAIILVIGLIYYAIRYVHLTFRNKITDFLQDVSNSGNDFFEKVISMFSDKRTFFIALSLILTLHAIVDAGVYLVPYTIGTQNPFYFLEESTHVPLFNFFSFDQSRFYSDFSLDGLGILWKFFYLPLIYLSSLFLFYVLLIFPFYLIYKSISSQDTKISRWLVISTLTCIIIYGISYYIGIQNPIGFDISPNPNVIGVDIFTNEVLSDHIPNHLDSILFILSFLLGVVFLYLLSRVRFEFLKKSFLLVVLVFFVFYIALFGISSIQNEFSSIKEHLMGSGIKEDYHLYAPIHDSYTDKRSFTFTLESDSSSRIRFTYFEDERDVSYLHMEIPEEYSRYWYGFKDNENIHLEEGTTYKYSSEGISFEEGDVVLIYKIGEGIEFTSIFISEQMPEILRIKGPEEKQYFGIYIEILRFLTSVVFYGLALIFYVIYFLRTRFYGSSTKNL